MPIPHLLLLLAVVFLWGINFIFVKLGLEEIPPLLLCSLRFFLASVPAVFFIRPPDLPFKIVASYGLFMFALQFSLVFMGMSVGMTPGMASLIMQVQVFFSLFFAALVLGERPRPSQVVGALVSFSGIVVVAFHFDQNVSLLGFLLILGSAASWGVGNIIAKKLKASHLISVIVWSTFILCLPMLAASYVFEGFDIWVNTYHHVTWKGFGSLLYIVYASTWLGYGAWNWLLGKYPMSMIVPFTLLVPIVGILSSVVVFDEPFQSWKLAACLLVLGGLCINILSTRYLNFKAAVKSA